MPRKTALIILLTMALSACGPSCEQQGGKLEFTHFIFVPQKIGDVTMLQQYPVYDCKLPEASK